MSIDLRRIGCTCLRVDCDQRCSFLSNELQVGTDENDGVKLFGQLEDMIDCDTQLSSVFESLEGP